MKLRVASLAMGWVALGFGRLMAQDLVLTPFGWLPSGSNPDQLPIRDRTLPQEVPASLSKLDRPTYARVREHLDEEGAVLSHIVLSELPWLEQPAESASMRSRTKPARREGKPVSSEVEYFLVFNPADSAEGATVSSRLIRPVTILLPGDKPDKTFVEFEFAINAGGEVIAMKPASNRVSAALVRRARETMSEWKFAPARRGGVPAESSIVVPVLFLVEPPASVATAASKPVPILRVPPVYPFHARREGVPGEVLIEAVVGVDGRPKKVSVLRASHRVFSAAAIKAVSAWRFRPAKSNGIPVEATFVQPISFSIAGEPSLSRLLSVRNDPEKLAKLPPALQWDEAPEYMFTQPAVYPFEAFAAKKEGTAQLVFVVDPEGRMAECKVVAASDPAFGGAALAMIETFKFQPASRLGRPSSALLNLTVNFQMKGNALVEIDADTLRLLERLKHHRETFVATEDLSTTLVPINRKNPVFPSSAGNVQTGEALIEFVVDRTGEVHLPRIITATSSDFGYAAAQAVAFWRFEPPVKGGKAVEVIVRHAVNFKRGE